MADTNDVAVCLHACTQILYGGDPYAIVCILNACHPNSPVIVRAMVRAGATPALRRYEVSCSLCSGTTENTTPQTRNKTRKLPCAPKSHVLHAHDAGHQQGPQDSGPTSCHTNFCCKAPYTALGHTQSKPAEDMMLL